MSEYQHVLSQPFKPLLSQSKKYRLHMIPTRQDNLIWLVELIGKKEICCIDGTELAPVLEYCRKQDLQLRYCLVTHLHGDHIGLLKDWHAQTEEQREQLPLLSTGCADATRSDIVFDIPLNADTEFELDAFAKIQVLRVDGHLNGHLAYRIDNFLFTGDTLFGGGSGYLFDGPPSAMAASLKKLAQLPGDTLICCGHEYTVDNLKFAQSVEAGNAQLKERALRCQALIAQGICTLPSQLSEELATNPFLRLDSEEILQAIGNSANTASGERLGNLRHLKNTKQYLIDRT